MPLESLSMHQSPYFPTSYGAYGADLAPGYYVGPGGWVYLVKSAQDITVVWSPQTKKDLSQRLSGDTASKAYAELQDRRAFSTVDEAKAAAVSFLSYAPASEAAGVSAGGALVPAAAAQETSGMGRKRPHGKGGAPAAPASTPVWVFVSIGAVTLLAVAGIAYAASRK